MHLILISELMFFISNTAAVGVTVTSYSSPTLISSSNSKKRPAQPVQSSRNAKQKQNKPPLGVPRVRTAPKKEPRIPKQSQPETIDRKSQRVDGYVYNTDFPVYSYVPGISGHASSQSPDSVHASPEILEDGVTDWFGLGFSNESLENDKTILLEDTRASDSLLKQSRTQRVTNSLL